MVTQPSESVNESVVTAIKATGDITRATADTVGRMLAATLADAGAPSATQTLSDVARGGISAAIQVSGHMGQAAKGIVIGALRGTKHVGVAALDTLAQVADAVIRHTAVAGGDPGHAATGLVEGAIHCAKELGVRAEDAADAAARGAVRGAEHAGPEAVQAVRDALSRTIRGVQVPVRDALEVRKNP